MDGDQVSFELTVSEEFAGEVEHGAPYSLDHVRAMGRSYGTLDLYLWQRWALHEGVDRVLEPRKLLCLANTPYKSYQQLRDRCERICMIWRECPFIWCPERRTIALRRRGSARRRPEPQATQRTERRHSGASHASTNPPYRPAKSTRPSGAQPRRIIQVPPWKRRRPATRPHNDPPDRFPDRLQSILSRLERLNDEHLIMSPHTAQAAREAPKTPEAPEAPTLPDPPAQSCTAPPLPPPRAAPAGQPAQVSASIEFARHRIEQMFEAIQTLFNAVLAYQPQ
jgi:hypothetical protein